MLRLTHASVQLGRDSNDFPPPTFTFDNGNSHRAYVLQNHETPNDEIGAALIPSQGRATHSLAVTGYTLIGLKLSELGAQLVRQDVYSFRSLALTL